MKILIIFLIWLSTFIGAYLLMSTIGILFTEYCNVISAQDWFIFYTIFIGTWLPGLVAREYYLSQREYFRKINF